MGDCKRAQQPLINAAVTTSARITTPYNLFLFLIAFPPYRIT
jgi:hypothetical protein